MRGTGGPSDAPRVGCRKPISFTTTSVACAALLPVAEAVEEAAEDAAVAGEGGAGWGRGGARGGDGLVVVGAGDGVDDLGFGEVGRAVDLGDVADQRAVAHDLGFQAGGAVGVPFGVAAAGQGYPDAELAG